jgi:hypothetical protein
MSYHLKKRGMILKRILALQNDIQYILLNFNSCKKLLPPLQLWADMFRNTN